MECMFCAYSQCRSSANIWWRVSDLGFKSMINFLTWGNKSLTELKAITSSKNRRVSKCNMIFGLGRNFVTIEEYVRLWFCFSKRKLSKYFE